MLKHIVVDNHLEPIATFTNKAQAYRHAERLTAVNPRRPHQVLSFRTGSYVVRSADDQGFGRVIKQFDCALKASRYCADLNIRHDGGFTVENVSAGRPDDTAVAAFQAHPRCNVPFVASNIDPN